MFKFILILFSLLYSLSLSVSASTIKVKKGDTLSSIAKSNDISLRELMDLNEIYDASKIKVGQTIKLPDHSAKKKQSIYLIKKGDTLLKIAKKYNLTTESILKINKIDNPDNLFPGTKLNLPYLKTSYKSNQIINAKDSTYAEESSISEVKQNKIKVDDINLDQWKDYDIIKVNWSKWKQHNGNHIAPSIHKNGKPLFIALNCESRRINATGINGNWREWFAPNHDFEHNLLNDKCNS